MGGEWFRWLLKLFPFLKPYTIRQMGKHAEVAGDGGGNYIISVGKVT